MMKKLKSLFLDQETTQEKQPSISLRVTVKLLLQILSGNLGDYFHLHLNIDEFFLKSAGPASSKIHKIARIRKYL